MKKISILLTVFSLFLASDCLAWSRFGHEIVIAVAQRHITPTTRQNVAKYFDYDIKKDAVWMDSHRNDEPIAYSTAWHVFAVEDNHRYDPNARLGKEDAIYSLSLADYNLSHYQELSDSAAIMNIRMLIHFVGDMHCPSHTYFDGQGCHWNCTVGEMSTNFHALYDRIPQYLFEGDADAVAAQIDNLSNSQIRKIQKGTPTDWAKLCADRVEEIYVINPRQTSTLDPDTIEKSRELVTEQLRDAGYRLAALLNKYFGK